MSTTVKELVRDQILKEGPEENELGMLGVFKRERYVDAQLNAMTNVELLEYISSAIEFGARTQWLFRRT